MQRLERVLNLLSKHEEKNKNSFYMVPSENILSPAAKIPFKYDAYHRYFFNQEDLWGSCAFHGGKYIGDIEKKILIPLFQELSEAEYVNVQAISGLNCMTLVLGSYCDPGDYVFIVPLEIGGHASTYTVAKKLGLQPIYMPPSGSNFDISLEDLRKLLVNYKPVLIYIDQSTFLFPIDIKKIRKLIDKYSPNTKLHYDTSHLNGLILGKVIDNPLLNGADSFGGSTHKTLPGPHKGFVVTNDEQINRKFKENSEHLISHHHMADVIALTITLIEFKCKGGAAYARQTLKNAKIFAKCLDELGFEVQGKERGYTGCHQVWVDPNNFMEAKKGSNELYKAGLIINTFDSLPTVNRPAFRIGLNEVSRLGLKEEEIEKLAAYFYDILVLKKESYLVREKVRKLRKEFSKPQYCFNINEIPEVLDKITK